MYVVGRGQGNRAGQQGTAKGLRGASGGGRTRLVRRHDEVDNLKIGLQAVADEDCAGVDELTELEVDCLEGLAAVGRRRGRGG